MLGVGTQHVHVPQRYRSADSFERAFMERFPNVQLHHVAPSGKDVHFVAHRLIHPSHLASWERKLWNAEEGIVPKSKSHAFVWGAIGFAAGFVACLLFCFAIADEMIEDDRRRAPHI